MIRLGSPEPTGVMKQRIIECLHSRAHLSPFFYGLVLIIKRKNYEWRRASGRRISVVGDGILAPQPFPGTMTSYYSIASAPLGTAAISRIAEYVDAPSFPCVGARAAFHKHRARFGLYGAIGRNSDVAQICGDLQTFSEEFPDPGSDPVTFLAMFGTAVGDERQFARRLWDQLQSMHAFDVHRFAWDSTVSADPDESDFSFSVAGRAFFVVGLHPNASRLSRRAPMPCLVFNFHNQFESLRSSGKYAGMQRVVRRRELDLQGSINPVLAQFGDASEARQYSGESVDQSWKCPFHQLAATHGA